MHIKNCKFKNPAKTFHEQPRVPPLCMGIVGVQLKTAIMSVRFWVGDQKPQRAILIYNFMYFHFDVRYKNVKCTLI
ncbi:hypothetical protein RRG08_057724 [Elysia crispata]|uniref:Uncharacterized protein n=1 Tax=Elysia crispata TaxID=231223 RepID=A0AAE1CQA5_9GAST|nr:hypothetical protein RRG08_057724 [Elysia crispata]